MSEIGSKRGSVRRSDFAAPFNWRGFSCRSGDLALRTARWTIRGDHAYRRELRDENSRARETGRRLQRQDTVKADRSGVDLANVKFSMNPFDEIAVEEALRLKEAGKAPEVVLASIGPAQSAETIRTGLTMGADHSILIKTDVSPEPLAVAKLLAKLIEAEGFGLFILGKQAIDDDSNQTGQMLARASRLGTGNVAFKVELSSDSVDVTREIDGGLQARFLGSFPAVVTTDLRLNEPRYAQPPPIPSRRRKRGWPRSRRPITASTLRASSKF